jgi:hypothetical protein
MQVDTNVSEADVGAVKPGQRAYFTVQSYPNRTFWGSVRQVREGPITVQNVVTYDVVIDVKNDDLALFPGMTADAHIITAERSNVLRVPLPAIRFNPEGVSRAPRAGGQGRGPRGRCAKRRLRPRIRAHPAKSVTCPGRGRNSRGRPADRAQPAGAHRYGCFVTASWFRCGCAPVSTMEH